MSAYFGPYSSYYVNSPNVPSSIEKYRLWNRARVGGDPALRPALDLNFAGNKSLVDEISGQNLVTFARATGPATYVDSDGLIKSASVNVPRFDHNPLTGESLGLLVEEQRTNRATYSVISTTGWSAADGASITNNQEIAPDGTLTAALVTFPAVNVPRIATSTTVASGNHTISVWIKAKTGTVTIRIGNANDFGSNQTVGTTWTRISYTSSAGSNSAGIYCANPVSAVEFYAWGFQEEAGTFPTSYIPTTGSTATRSADSASITGSNFSRWYNQSEGTMYVEDRGKGGGGTGGKSFVVNGSSVGSYSRLGVYDSNSSNFDSFTIPTNQDVNIFGANTNVFMKHAAGLANNNTSYYKDGGLIGTDTSCQISGRNIDNARIGDNIATNAKTNGVIRRLTYWNRRLPNSNLQSMTQ